MRLSVLRVGEAQTLGKICDIPILGLEIGQRKVGSPDLRRQLQRVDHQAERGKRRIMSCRLFRISSS
jgi:hypothetical protein